MKFEECNVNCSENINHNHGQKYLRQTLDFIWNSPLRKKGSISTFLELFTSIDKIFILGGRLNATLWFYKVLNFSWFFLIFWDRNSQVDQQLVGQLEYTLFIAINCGLFYFSWKENLVKHKRFSKYYDNDFL